jgi:hypothetical protein
MTPPAIRPRPDQISELSRGLLLPLPEVQSDHLEIIAEGLTRAFLEIRHQSPQVTASGSEAELTALMEARLNKLIKQDPFWGQLVVCVARGKESLSFDGSHLEKRPDLSIYLSNGNLGFPLITEAKILDSKAGQTERLYCEKGLRRFLEGEYAWGTREAFMMAYVRDGSSIATKLTPFLSSKAPLASNGYLVEELPTPVECAAGDLAWSKHGRKFAYGHQAPPMNLPGPISLWHLWLS